MWFLRRFFNVLSNYKAMEANEHWDGVILGHMGMLFRINFKLHITMLHTKYRSIGPCSFREEFFQVFPIESLWQVMTPWGGAYMDPRDTVDRIYKEGYYALLHTKY